LRASISQYENRINQTPVREQQEASILRDTEVLRHNTRICRRKNRNRNWRPTWRSNREDSSSGSSIPPAFPVVPSFPKRVKMSLGGAAGGLALGLILAIFMEMRDTSYHTESDLTKHLAPPFVLGIPLLPTPLEKRRKTWRNLFQWAAASAMVLVVLAAEFYVYRRG
jgi:hypothetical protein